MTVPKTLVKKVISQNGIKRLISKRKPTLLGISRLMMEVAERFRPIEIDLKSTSNQSKKKLAAIERLRNLDGVDLANRRYIFVPGIKKDTVSVGRKGLKPAWGCHQMCLIMYSALKEIESKSGVKLNPKIARYLKVSRTDPSRGTMHSSLFFELHGKLYEADPYFFLLNGKRIKLVTKEDLKKLEMVNNKPISALEYLTVNHGLDYPKGI